MLTITNLGHASFLIKNDDVSVIIDPYQDDSVPGLKMPRIKANYVFCSHNHFDHCAKGLITQVPTNKDVEYEVIHEFHDHHNGAHRGLNDMYLFHFDGYRILHTGDLGHIPDQKVIEQIKGVDIMLAPINGHFTISANELFEIAKLVQPKVLIPMHYYHKEDNSGYPDGNQIDIFKQLVKNFKTIDGYTIIVNDDLLENRVVIYDKALQE